MGGRVRRDRRNLRSNIRAPITKIELQSAAVIPMLICRTLFILIIVSAFTITDAPAQKTSTKPRTQSAPASASSKAKTRTQGAAKPIIQQPEIKPASDVNSTPESSVAEPSPTVPPGPEANTPKTTEKPDQKPVAPATVEAPPTVVADPIVTLHDQIEAAATPQERMSLQLKLAELLVANNKKTEAIAELQKASSGSSFDPQGLYNVGNALARLGDADGAIASYRKAIGQRNGGYSRALNNLGVVLLRVGRWDEAFDALSSALKLENFRYAEASYNLGRLYAARGQTDLAAREWHRAIAVDPGHSAASKALARMGNDERITVEQPATKNRATTTNAASTPAAER